MIQKGVCLRDQIMVLFWVINYIITYTNALELMPISQYNVYEVIKISIIFQYNSLLIRKNGHQLAFTNLDSNTVTYFCYDQLDKRKSPLLSNSIQKD